jgi:serpin B
MVLALLNAGQNCTLKVKAAQNDYATSKKFAFNLFNKVSQAKNTQNSNVLISPFSAYAALSMALNGAGGATREQMAKTLGTTAANLEQLNKRNQDALIKLSRSETVKLEVANALFADSSLNLKGNFLYICEHLYHAEALREPFSNPATVKKINSWCDEKTHGKIKEIIDKLSDDEKMVLLNAIYFKGDWQAKFEKEATSNDKFTAANGSSQTVKMMHHETTSLRYLKGASFQSVALPYKGEKQSLYIFLPDKDSNITAFQAQLNNENWNSWMKSFKSTDVFLSMPRFTINYSAQLNDVLSSMGMADAFDREKADFSNLLEQKKRAWIGRVLQKTFMLLNEEGTEAAAVTAITFRAESARMRPEKPIDFKVDRPFVIALVDQETDEILFLGKIADLDQKSK